MFLIIAALAVAAIYSGGMYLYSVYRFYDLDRNGALNAMVQDEIAEFTFRLALCFILAVGFLGLLLK